MLGAFDPNSSLHMQRKNQIFDFTTNTTGNMKTLNNQKYNQQTLQKLSDTKNMHNSFTRINGTENNPMRNSRNNTLIRRYNIITNQYQNYGV